ncbi:TPA: hypothetical protein ACPE2G_004542, partial [Citrobacter braakii]
MKNKLMLSLLALILTTMTLTVEAKVPSQIIYRYDDNRYLELKGFNCDGALWYHDNKRSIHKEIYDGIFASFRIFTGEYIHPSDKYIFIPEWEPGAYTISKDYGQTWEVASYIS